MGRPERHLDPDAGPLQRFAYQLRELRVAAGRPSYRQLSRRAHFSVTALSEAAGGEIVPTLPVVLAYAEACGGDRTVWEDRWRRLVADVTPPAPAPVHDDADAPYLGLATFEPGDADRYFGRERLVEELCDRLATAPFLAVFGPSGAGKSSLIRAGLLPAIMDGRVAGGLEWMTVLLTPGERPVEELAIHLANLKNIPAGSLYDALTADPARIRLTIRQVLADRPEPARVVIVVDQFEEVFTLCREDTERAAFIELLTAVTAEPGARVVLGMRADFYPRCAAYPALVTALRDHQVLIGPMDDDDLRQVVTGPARRDGLKVEPALVEVAVGDSRGQPGALPLLSHALLETWHRRRGATLTLADYLAAGGVQGAIAQSAERIYGEFDAAGQHLVREVFLRLTAFGEGTEDTRRRATPEELLGGPDGQAVAGVLSRLTAARLVTADADSVTVAHEALIQSWPRLRGWLAEDREQLRTHRRLTEAAAEWDQHEREDGFLYRGARLAVWEGRRADRLNDQEYAFLLASRGREARDRAAGRRRTRLALSGLGATVAVVSVLAAVALVQARSAEAGRELAQSRQLTAEARSQLQLDPELALRLARRAYGIRPTTEAEMVLRQAVADHRVRAVVPSQGARALGVAVSPDGRRLATSAADGTVRVWPWDPATGAIGAPVLLRGHQSEAWSPVFSPDGRRLATAGIDGTVRIWAADGTGTPVVLSGHTGAVWTVSFSPDGRRVASAGNDGTVRIWAADGTGTPVVLRGHKGPVVGVAFGPDGRRLASGGHDDTVRIWDLVGRAAPLVLAGHEAHVKTVAFSPDGTRVASASTDGTARVWPTTGAGPPAVLRGHQGTVEGLAFSPDGHWVATTSDDTTVRVWNSTGAGDPLVLRGHKGTVWAVTFGPDGTWLASAGQDGSIRTWDPRGAGDPVLLRGHQGASWTAELTRDSRYVVSGGEDGTIRVWDPAGREEPRVLRGHDGDVTGLTISQDGRRMASSGIDGTVRIWDLAGGGDPVVLRGHEGIVWVAALSPDGHRVASAGKDATLRVWATDGTGTPIVQRGHTQQIRHAAFSPDGRRVATAGEDGTVRIWDAGGAAEPVVRRGHDGLVYAVAFSPDGRSVASAGTDGTVRIWPVTGNRAPTVLHGHLGFVWYLGFSPDGRWLVSSGKDATVRVWRTDGTGPPITFAGFGATVETVVFGPDSTRLVTTHGDGTVRVWKCVACGPIARVVDLATE